MYSDSPLAKLTPLFAVLTLPLGILAALFFGISTAIAVFVVGWLLLTPASAVLFGVGLPGESWADGEVQDLVQERMQEEIRDSLAEGSSADPIEKLRQRYAQGEITEAELEHRLEALLELEDVDPADEASIQRAIDNLDTASTERDGSSGGEREPEAESEATEMELDRE